MLSIEKIESQKGRDRVSPSQVGLEINLASIHHWPILPMGDVSLIHLSYGWYILNDLSYILLMGDASYIYLTCILDTSYLWVMNIRCTFEVS